MILESAFHYLADNSQQNLKHFKMISDSLERVVLAQDRHVNGIFSSPGLLFSLQSIYCQQGLCVSLLALGFQSHARDHRHSQKRYIFSPFSTEGAGGC